MPISHLPENLAPCPESESEFIIKIHIQASDKRWDSMIVFSNVILIFMGNFK